MKKPRYRPPEKPSWRKKHSDAGHMKARALRRFGEKYRAALAEPESEVFS